jgi:hypothetical protein
MTDQLWNQVVLKLNDIHEVLVQYVTAELVEQLPPIGVPSQAADKAERHHRNMAQTAQRFHEIVYAGASIDWGLVDSEFAWAGRKLQQMGATWEHQSILIRSYFDAAAQMHPWTDEEQTVLREIQARMYSVAQPAYTPALSEA